METYENKVKCIIDGANGIYVPKRFGEDFITGWDGVSKEDRDILCAGPDHEYYWEAWDAVQGSASYRHKEHTWTLYQDGDLYAVRDDMTENDWEQFSG